jgi:hypothetical protein
MRLLFPDLLMPVIKMIFLRDNSSKLKEISRFFNSFSSAYSVHSSNSFSIGSSDRTIIYQNRLLVKQYLNKNPDIVFPQNDFALKSSPQKTISRIMDKEELIQCYRYFVYKCGNIKRLSLAEIEEGKCRGHSCRNVIKYLTAARTSRNQ